MAVRDKAVVWFFQHYIMPRAQIIDKPGFVAFNVSYKTNIYSRQVIMPESLFVSLEKRVIEDYGKVGGRALYSLGKKFGYRFATMSNVVDIKDANRKDFLRYVDILSKFVEGTYARNLSSSVNLKKSIIKFNFNDFIICRKSGIGYIFSSGGIAGIWARMLCNPKIEAFQPKCQGRGDEKCTVISAPLKILDEIGYKAMSEGNLSGLEMGTNYRSMNDIRSVQYAKSSLKDFIEDRFFSFNRGMINYKGDRYFIVEASLNYLLEMELKRFKWGEGLLFDISFEYGKALAKKEVHNNPCKFITDFMSALGWGDILASKRGGDYNVSVNCFPWTNWYRDIKYIIFRGILSGIISGFSGRKVVLKNFKTYILGDQMKLICYE